MCGSGFYDECEIHRGYCNSCCLQYHEEDDFDADELGLDPEEEYDA